MRTAPVPEGLIDHGAQVPPAGVPADVEARRPPRADPRRGVAAGDLDATQVSPGPRVVAEESCLSVDRPVVVRPPADLQGRPVTPTDRAWSGQPDRRADLSEDDVPGRRRRDRVVP